MTGKDDRAKPDIMDHYRPLAIRAVAAACAIKPQALPQAEAQPDEVVYSSADLPPGFHMPQSVRDD